MSKINAKTIIQYVVPPIITVGLCFFLYRDMNWADVMDGLNSCSWWLLGLFVLAEFAAMVLRALRWRMQLRPLGANPKMSVMCASIFGTYAVNIVFPRLGEVWRCSYIARLTKLSFSQAFGSMVADRIADMVAMGLLTVATFIGMSAAMEHFLSQTDFGPRLQALLHSPWLWVGAAIAIVSMVLLLRLPKVRQFVMRMWNGFSAIFTMEGKWIWVLLVLAVWVCYFFSMYFSMLAYPPTAHLGLKVVFVTFIFGTLGMVVPSTGGIGPWQVAVVLALNGLYGVPYAQALTFATINLTFTNLLIIFLGIITFLRRPK